MASMLNETMATAKNIMGSAREGSLHAVDAAKSAVEAAKDGTGHAVTSARSSLLDGVHTVSGIVSMLRGLDSNDALGWVGLSRRRSPIVTMAIFSAGFAVGAGAGVLFAPTSGKDLRGSLLKAWKGLMSDAKGAAESAASEVVKIEHKAEDLAGKAKDAVVKAEHEVENKVAAGAEAIKDGVKTKAAAAASAIKETVNDAKSVVSAASDPAHETPSSNDANKPHRSGPGHRAS
jgi:gas vesicle protein